MDNFTSARKVRQKENAQVFEDDPPVDVTMTDLLSSQSSRPFAEGFGGVQETKVFKCGPFDRSAPCHEL